MDPKRKRIYIVTIVICLVALVGVMFWSRSGSSGDEVVLSSAVPVLSEPSAPTASAGKVNSNIIYTPPSVFPQNTRFENSVINQLKTYQTFNGLKLTEGELGRPNPFGNY